MESKQVMLEFLQNLLIIGGAFTLIWKGIVEYFRLLREGRVTSIEQMIDKKIDARVQGLERRLAEMNQEFHKSIIEIFKEFK